ncbi:MAG: AAA family ATPase, partial [Aminobacterium colombiense]|nr:AAA family ATPase [Aminobacterium colombiense]
MRFIEFKIRSFGLLENMEGHFPAGLSLILGDNESGKTTLMSFLRYSLFGCPDGRSNRNLYAPPHGGKQKGSLIIESLKGERFSLVMNGRNSTFSGARNGTSLEDLLGYVDREMYERIFAVGLEDMQKIRPLNDQGIQSRFFSAGAGLRSEE